MDPDEQARQRFAALMLQRQQASKAESDRLAPREHGAFAELRVRDHPLWGPIEQLAAIPTYEALKKAGLLGVLGMEDERTSPASLEAMAEAYRGVGRGIKGNLFGE